MKTCSKCKQELNLSCFYNNRRMSDGLSNYCKNCHNEINIQWRKSNINIVRRYCKEWKGRKRNHVKEYNKKYHDENDKLNPELVLFRNAKKRAKKFNRELNITKEDIKAVYTLTCPICGKEMKRNTEGIGQSADSPTLDRIDNDKGYIKDNIQVICQSCNSKKDK